MGATKSEDWFGPNLGGKMKKGIGFTMKAALLELMILSAEECVAVSKSYLYLELCVTLTFETQILDSLRRILQTRMGAGRKLNR